MSYTPGIGGDSAQLAQRISSNIQKITQCSVEIQRTLNQLGTPQDSPELRQQLQQKQQYTNQLAKETDKYIKEFGSLPTTPSEQRQRKIQKDRLVAEFTTSLTNFQKAQRQAAEREKEFVARVRASSRVSGGFPEDSSKEKNLVSWESQTQPQVQVQDEEITEDDLRLIHERESSIRQLEADIMDINEIFKDLGMMIHEQGDMIDSIEANVESAEVHVQQANQQLSRAADYQGGRTYLGSQFEEYSLPTTVEKTWSAGGFMVAGECSYNVLPPHLLAEQETKTRKEVGLGYTSQGFSD